MEFEAGEEARKVWGVGTNNIMIQADDSIPRGTIRFCVTYNADHIEPYAYWSQEEGIVLSYSRKDYDDEAALVMEAKDIVLRNLKKGKVVLVDTIDDLEKVIVLVNSESEEDVRLMY